MVPCSAGVASRSRSHSSCSGDRSPWWYSGTVVSSATIRRPSRSWTRSCGPVVVGVEQAPGVRRPLVVVAHHPDHLRAELGSGRLDQLAQPRVGVRLGLVGEVAGEHQRLGHRVEPGQPLERHPQSVLGLDDAVLPHAAGEQVDVAQVGDGEPRGGVLAVLHGGNLAARSRVPVGRPGSAGRCAPRTWRSWARSPASSATRGPGPLRTARSQAPRTSCGRTRPSLCRRRRAGCPPRAASSARRSRSRRSGSCHRRARTAAAWCARSRTCGRARSG